MRSRRCVAAAAGHRATRASSTATGAYHSREGRSELRRRHIKPRIAWLHQYRRLRIRYERRDDIHEAFLAIGCSLICLKLLEAEGSF